MLGGLLPFIALAHSLDQFQMFPTSSQMIPASAASNPRPTSRRPTVEKVEENSLYQMMQYTDIREKLSRPPRNLGDLNMGRVAALTITHKESHPQSAQQEQETRHQDVTATELTSECMLLHEALEMNHCVHIYGSRAEQGTVRIFSLTQESGNRATASIILRNGLWQQEQTRGRRNHPTTDAMRECTLALAEACNQE